MNLGIPFNCGRLLSVLLFSLSLISPNASAKSVPTRDRKYLQRLYADTWRCLDYFVSPKTGLPYDSHEKKPSTSITNIGFYMASTAVAGKTGLIRPEEALARLQKALASLALIEKWKGFPVTWVNVETLETTEKKFSTVDHLGNLTASLILVKGLYPSLEEPIDALLNPMDWLIFYEHQNHLYRGGYDLETHAFDVKQPWGDWYYSYLGADTRLGSFFGIASGQVPIEHWQALNRSVEERLGQSYFVPGWQGGGLFMQCISGLFLDERFTVLGKSAANFAFAQILHAERISAPVWGWSASVSPTGEYLGWGALRDEIVSPHASALVVSYYPQRVVYNLRLLENRGARERFSENSEKFSFGFRDSMNWQTGQLAGGYLSLDQAMLFMALANFLHNGIIWKTMSDDPVVRKGISLLTEYRERDPEAAKVYDRRDRGLLTTTPSLDFP